MSDESTREVRLRKLARMRELGQDPFANERFERTASAEALLAMFPEEGDFPEGGAPEVRFAGRIVSYRLMGKAGFAHVSDGDSKIQAYFRKDDLGETGWELYELLDIGDHVGVEGYLFLTKSGERSVHVRELTPLSKCLENLPIGKEKEGKQWYALEDVEVRYRHRHLDLVANPPVRETLVARSKIVSAARKYFESKGYMEVETPILQTVAGGAMARPFKTHYNAYDMDVKLRISLELYLKRLICGDLPKVFEIGKVFRNEGVSNRHNPEFTLLEWYEAYANLEDMMGMVEGLFRFVAEEVFGGALAQVPSDPTDSADQNDQTDQPDFPDSPDKSHRTYDFSKRWRRADLLSEIERLSGVKPDELRDLEAAKSAMARAGLPSEKEDNVGGIIEKLLEHFVEPTLIEPTFVVGYPIETSPLAKKDPKNPRFTRRFEAYVGGREVANAFSEINDPLDQRERFEAQVAASERREAMGEMETAKGDRRKVKGEAGPLSPIANRLSPGEAEEVHTHPMDEEFLYALECGMPPAGGCGIGIDRLVMTFTGAEGIREVILFPTMKPEKPSES